ncbi:MAG: sulfite exporter TauE/SafE family protein [Bacteroidia bacterium]
MDTYQFDFWFLVLVLVIGLAGGFLAGLLGVGGGLVFVPVFQEIVRNHLIETDKVSYVLANSLFVVFVVGISGSYKQYKLKNTHIPSALYTGLSAIFSSLTLSFILKYYDLNNQKVFNYIFSGILILTAWRMWAGRNSKESQSEVLNLPKLSKFIPAGLFSGFITALTGLGGGVIMIPYFTRIMKLPVKFSTGLSLTVIPIIAFPLLLFYIFNGPQQEMYPGWQTGHILWPAILPMIIAAGIASPLGVKVANMIKPKTLLTVFLIFITINIIKILLF